MVDQTCTWFSDICRQDVSLAGGKGANLGDMAQAGLPIPPGFVIVAPAYQRMLADSGLDARIARLTAGLDHSTSEALHGAEQAIRALFEEVPLPASLQSQVRAYYQELGEGVPVAVRSSATAEDLAGASFAGQQETFLNVVGAEDLLGAVRRCWSSLFTAQAIFYRRQKGFDHAQVSMAVVVQKMINAEKSGVIFTVDPVLRNHFQMIVEAVWGLGEGIVSGRITPDHYKVDRENYEIIFSFVPEKPIMITREAGGGVVTQNVAPERVSAQILAPEEIQQLVDLGNRVEEHFGCPQDIEWSIEDGQVYLLQSRPITCL